MALPQQLRNPAHDQDIDRDALIAHYVETAPAYPTPDRARLGDFGVSVTAIITQLQLEYWDISEVGRVYEVPVEAVRAAIAYYERHKAVIDARIILNAAGFTSEGQTHEPEAVLSLPELLEAEARSIQEREDLEDALINRHVETAPDCSTPDKARLVESGTSVTAIVSELQRSLWSISETAQAFDVSQEAVRAAIMYYGRHRQVIDARITLNYASFDR